MALSGLLPASQLATITGTTRAVRFDLLAQTDALRRAFFAYFGKALVVTDGYRSYQSQVDVFTARYTKTYLAGRPYRVWNGERWYQRPGTAVAAVPGTSNHGWAQALDLGSGVNSSLSSAEFLWMMKWGPLFGYTHPAWAKQPGSLEPWHWEAVYVPPSNYTPVDPTPGPTPPDPTPTPPEEDDMYSDADRARDNQTNQQAIDANLNATRAYQNAEAARVQALAATNLTQQVLDLLQKVFKGQGQITQEMLREFDDITEDLGEIRARAALATRKMYTDIEQEFHTYAEMAAGKATYEELAGVRDPLQATVTVEATIPPGQIEEEVKDALVASAPALAEAVADEEYRRMKE